MRRSHTVPLYQVVVGHELGRESARRRVERLLERAMAQYAAHLSDATGDWTGDELEFRFVASGLGINGKLVVEETQVSVAGPLPLAAAFFRGRIERMIRDELERLLAGE
jgi:hypothetical protein